MTPVKFFVSSQMRGKAWDCVVASFRSRIVHQKLRRPLRHTFISIQDLVKGPWR